MGIKDIRRNYILEQAIRLFCENSITDIKIKDVAQHCNIGEATFYRYYPKRSKLVIACALRLQEKVCEYFFDVTGGTGYDQLTRFYHRYYEIFCDHPEYYRFLSEFDAYCISEEVKDLDLYSENLDVFKEKFFEAYQQGVTDGTVREIKNFDLFYYSTTHALLSLCKKLAAEAYIVKQDKLTDKRQEVRMMIEIILQSITK